MLLNGSSFNRAVLNGAAALLVIAASASWSAEATVSSQASRKQYISGTWAGDVQGYFGPVGLYSVRGGWSSSAQADLQSSCIRSGHAGWASSGSLHAYLIRMIPAYAGFDAYATMTAVPNAKLAYADWSSDGSVAVATFEPHQLKYVRGNWTPGATLAFYDALVTRYVVGEINGTCSAWLEPTRTHNGVTQHSAWTFPSATGRMTVDSAKTTLFTHSSIGTGYSDIDAPAFVRYKGAGAWSASVAWSGRVGVKRYATGGMSAGAVSVFSDPTYVKRPTATWSAAASLTSQAVVRQAAAVSSSAGAELSAASIYTGKPKMTLSASASFSATGRDPVRASADLSAGCAQLFLPRHRIASQAPWSAGVAASFVPTDPKRGVWSQSASATTWMVAKPIWGGRMVLSATAALASNETFNESVQGEMAASSDFEAVPSSEQVAEARWTITTGELMVAHKFSLAQAPDSRTFFVPSDFRTFAVPEQIRIFEVS